MSSPWIGRFWTGLVVVLTISGFAQMPLFKRYYIADLPGMAWTADFYFTHVLHYIGAVFLLGLAGWVATAWVLGAGRLCRLTSGGWLKIWLLVGIIGTGALRMYKNQPGVSYSPQFTMVVDWTHLGLVVLLGLVALGLKLSSKGRYAVHR